MPHRIPESKEDLERRVLELSGLLEVARALVAAPDADAALRQFLLSAIGVVGATSAGVFRYDDPTGRLIQTVARGLPHKPARAGTVLSADEVGFLEGSEAREGLAFRPRPTSLAARTFVREHGEWLAGYEAEAVVPLVGRGGLWGVAIFGPRLLGEEYSEAELAILASSAQIAASALENLAFHAEGGGTSREREVEELPAVPSASPFAPIPADADLSVLREQHPMLERIVGDSPTLSEAIKELCQVAPTRCPVLILGETGTGKELAARAVHDMSPRHDGPFEVVNCGAIPQELIESELFGHLRGAFTGATRDRRGAFELAHGGTLFLDEIGELPSGAQTRLLRVLQEGHMRRVGDERTIHVDVRVVAATNRDLLAEVKRRRFRADLYYRIGVFTVQLPPLRERKGDLPVLAKALMARLADENGRPVPQLSSAVLRRLSEYSFPGNVRELQNLLTVLLLRSVGDSPSLEEVEAVLAQAGGDDGPAHAASRERDDEDGEGAPARGDAEATGRWVLDQLRRSDFNLSQAERSLARLRRSPAGRAAAPVADRSSLTYYFQGECFKAFADSAFDLESAARQVASIADLEPRARARMKGFLSFIAGVAAECDDEDAAQAACRERLPKLPAHYAPYLDEVAGGFVRGEWALTEES